MHQPPPGRLFISAFGSLAWLTGKGKNSNEKTDDLFDSDGIIDTSSLDQRPIASKVGASIHAGYLGVAW